MSTRLQLGYPFSRDYKAGYLNINKEPRRVVMLVRKDGSMTSTSYARYLMTCHLQRYLLPQEHVDHIDNDKMNDVISNLQVLSQRDNQLKYNKDLGISKEYITLECPICGEIFTREARQIRPKIKAGKTPTCSRQCGGKMSHITKGE